MAPWELDAAELEQLTALELGAVDPGAAAAAWRPCWRVYLLHFHARLSGHALHYLGSAPNVPRRLELHHRGTSKVRIMRALYQAGIGFDVVRLWEGGRTLERELKGRPCGSVNLDRLCPVCHPRLEARLGTDDYDHYPAHRQAGASCARCADERGRTRGSRQGTVRGLEAAPLPHPQLAQV